MATYAETITASKTWSCPKTGVWKVICVGGGGGGYYKSSSSTSTANTGGSGGTTSFGSYLSASGGASGSDGTPVAAGYSGGLNGFNGAGEYGSPSHRGVGTGYGASGGISTSTTSSVGVDAGMPGEVKSMILDISSGVSVTCTIGSGGASATSVCGGKSGAIMLQYLGSSI